MVPRVLPYENETVMGEMRVQITFEASKVRCVFSNYLWSGIVGLPRKHGVHIVYRTIRGGSCLFVIMLVSVWKDRIADVFLSLLHPFIILVILSTHVTQLWTPPTAYPSPHLRSAITEFPTVSQTWANPSPHSPRHSHTP